MENWNGKKEYKGKQNYEMEENWEKGFKIKGILVKKKKYALREFEKRKIEKKGK